MAGLKRGAVHLPSEGGTLERFKELASTSSLRVGLYGLPKSYKTSLALSFPPPIYLINFDREASPLKRWFKDKEIYVHDILVPPDKELDPEETGSILSEFLDSYLGALDQPKGTVVIDTVTVLWALIEIFVLKGVLARKEVKYARSSKKGKPPEVEQWDWADANTLYENVLLAAKGKALHTVFVARSKPEYNSHGSPTGGFEPRCQNSTPFLVNLWLRMERTMVAESKIVRGKRRNVEVPAYMATVEGSGFGSDQEGRELINPTYDDLAALAAEEVE